MSIQEADASPEITDRKSLVWRWGVSYEDFFVAAASSDLLTEHWNESGMFRDMLDLNLDHAYYLGLERAGLIDILMVDEGARLVGYAVLLKQRYPRSRGTTAGTVDAMYARPEFRGAGLAGGLGWQMMKASVERLRQAGITLALFREKIGYGGHLKRLGFAPVSTTWGLVLNQPRRPA